MAAVYYCVQKTEEEERMEQYKERAGERQQGKQRQGGRRLGREILSWAAIVICAYAVAFFF